DVCFLSTTVPKMLINIQTQDKSISYAGCLAQIYCFMLFSCLDSFLLTGMAFDCCVAICHPLHYTSIMSPQLCAWTIVVSWSIGSLDALLHTLMVVRLSFCAGNEIHHFFCELSQLLKLSCTDTLFNEVLVYVVLVALGVVPLTGLLFSYSCIISTILRIPSPGGRYKVFSTCGSHLSVVSLYYGTGLGIYFSQISSTQTSGMGFVASVMFMVVSPMLNPFIYSLRNKAMKESLSNVFSRKSLPKRL
ncbi:putative gustatory receptor clone PTE03, partial [Tachyglossus aculeatus]|uniref:putative gustatory receptor clone PTE03 n=1 Tax=Tachyglossus aculeatus TaxID=9261 RepID=UPI0018F5F63E